MQKTWLLVLRRSDYDGHTGTSSAANALGGRSLIVDDVQGRIVAHFAGACYG